MAEQTIAELQEQMTNMQTVLNVLQTENAGLRAQNAQALDTPREAVVARPAGGACPRRLVDPQGLKREVAQQSGLIARLATAVAVLPEALARRLQRRPEGQGAPPDVTAERPHRRGGYPERVEGLRVLGAQPGVLRLQNVQHRLHVGHLHLQRCDGLLRHLAASGSGSRSCAPCQPPVEAGPSSRAPHWLACRGPGTRTVAPATTIRNYVILSFDGSNRFA